MLQWLRNNVVYTSLVALWHACPGPLFVHVVRSLTKPVLVVLCPTELAHPVTELSLIQPWSKFLPTFSIGQGFPSFAVVTSALPTAYKVKRNSNSLKAPNASCQGLSFSAKTQRCDCWSQVKVLIVLVAINISVAKTLKRLMSVSGDKRPAGTISSCLKREICH